ncbi:protein of unknown function DUF397 [Actinobacteria bacterium OV450]|nr:protein of unknown function DUF397 [Actinobacteria bacterium OV450]
MLERNGEKKKTGSDTEELYARTIVGPYAALCGGGTNDGNMEDCITIAELAGGGYSLRDSKDEDRSDLRYSADEITTFARAWLARIDG